MFIDSYVQPPYLIGGNNICYYKKKKAVVQTNLNLFGTTQDHLSFLNLADLLRNASTIALEEAMWCFEAPSWSLGFAICHHCGAGESQVLLGLVSSVNEEAGWDNW